MRGALPPVLDARDDDQILLQLRKLAALHVPEWRGDPSVRPDAGTMLLRIFARLVEITLKRLNKAPEKNFSTFLNATGIGLLPPVSARVPLTFAATAGSGPILVPQGTRAGTTPQGDQEPVDFETAADVTVIPATLAAAWTLDPGWDRYSEHSTIVDQPSERGFSPFVGSRRLPHVLYLGDEHLLDFSLAKVAVKFTEGEDQELLRQLQSIKWGYVSGGHVVDDLSFAVVSANERVEIRFQEPLRQIDRTVLSGPSDTLSLRQGVRNCWLQATLNEPLVADEHFERLFFKNIRLEVSREAFLPEGAFFNATPIDVTTSFQPFGNSPKIGDAFYLSCSEALAKPNLVLKLAFEIAGTPMKNVVTKPTLKWEVLGDTGWVAVETSGLEDTTNSLSTSGVVTLRLPSAILGKVNGKEGRWVRVRIHEGDYGKTAEYVELSPGDPAKGYKLREGTANLTPPIVSKLTVSYIAQGIPQSLVTRNGFLLTDRTLANPDGFHPFVALQRLKSSIYADTGPSLYLGFDRAFPEQPLSLYIVVAPRALPGTLSFELDALPTESLVFPSLRWEYFNGAGWAELPVLDQTGQFARSGTVDILTPTDIAPLARFDLKESYWIRAILVPKGQATDADPPFRDDPTSSPRLAAIFLNTIPAVQAVTVGKEILGSGNSLPGQTFRLSQKPVLANQEILVLETELPPAVEGDELLKEEGAEAIQEQVNPATGESETWIRWHEVSSFNGSASHSRHYTLDHGTGEVVFGDGVRGLIPSLGTDNIMANYRAGAGSGGNVPKGAIAQLKSQVAGIASVTNLLEADGGADLETAETARQRGPQTLRHRGSAVSRTDFEWLAREAAGTRLARVICVPNINRNFLPESGWVTLVIVPHGTERRLVPSVELIGQVEEALGHRAFAGLNAFHRINVTGPGYVEVAVVAEVVPFDVRQAAPVKSHVTEALDKFLHPLTGGPRADGWQLGRKVFVSEIASVIQAVPGVDHLKSLRLIPNQSQHRLRLARPFVFSQDLPDGTSIVSTDGHKCALLAESIPGETEVTSLYLRGLQVGDRLLKWNPPHGSFNPPFTISSVEVDREKAIQLVSIEPCDFEMPEVGTVLSTPDQRVRNPISAINSATPSTFLTLEDFKSGEEVQILLPGEAQTLDFHIEIETVLPAPDVIVGGISLMCSGQHRISVTAERAANSGAI